jgi:outer membrane protein insertion porin family
MAGPWARVAMATVLSAFPTAAVPAATADLPVTSISVDVEGGRVEPGLADRLGVVSGAPVDRRALRSGIQSVYAEGWVDRIRVTTEREDDGLAVSIEVTTRARLAEIRIDHPEWQWRRRARRWAELEPGEPVNAARIQAAAARVERETRQRGWSEAVVEPYVDWYRETNTAVVTLDVDLGEPRRLLAVDVQGVDPDVAKLADPDLKTGRRLTDRLEDRARDRVESAVRELGYWEAQVVGSSVRGEGDQSILEIDVDPGPHYALDVESPTDMNDVVIDAIPEPGTDELHPAQTDALAERIRLELQADGYLLAEVSAELDSLGPARVLRIRAEPGVIREVASVEFPGAEAITADRLRAVVDVRPGRTHGWFGRRVDDDRLEDDRRSLLDLYRRSGFPDADVGRPQLTADGPGAVVVSFPITEGRQWRITGLRVAGVPADAAAVLDTAAVESLEGAPWDPREVESARRRLETSMFDVGYPDATVSSETDVSDPGRVAVDLTVDSGDYVRFGDVVIAGLERTDEAVVRRALDRAGLVADATYSRAAQIDAQRRLYELGLFRRIEIGPVPGQERRLRRSIVVRIDEGDQRSYLVGFGYDTVDDFRITLGWSHLNLFGGAHALSAEVRLSSREERWQVGLREPRFTRFDVPAFAAVYSTAEDFDTWRQRREGVWFEIGDRVRQPHRWWFRPEYQIVEPDAPDDILSELEREQQRIRIFSLTPTYEWDTRNDPLSPSRGQMASASLTWATPWFGTDADFLKAQASWSGYRPAGSGTFAVGLRIGAIEPLSTTGDDPPNLQIPIAERFFAGGRVSHRAFPIDKLGVPGQTLDDNGDPIGGNALLLLNVEYQRPLWSFLSSVVFLDAGNVWESPSSVDLGQVRWGLGVGLRFATPAGPFRLEYGHKLDRKEGESSGEWYLSFGVPF